VSTSDTSHFSLEGGETPTGTGRFVKVADVDGVEFVPGLNFQPVLGESMLANFVTFEPHVEAPMHVHVEEQIVVVTSGEFDFTIDGETRTLRPGDVAVVPPWVPHGAVAGAQGCTEIDFFSPPRATLLDAAKAAVAQARTTSETA
jgi:quercetin dioxygenase-like cupin family protein